MTFKTLRGREPQISLAVRVTPAVYAELLDIVARERITLSDFVRRAVANELERYRKEADHYGRA